MAGWSFPQLAQSDLHQGLQQGRDLKIQVADPCSGSTQQFKACFPQVSRSYGCECSFRFWSHQVLKACGMGMMAIALVAGGSNGAAIANQGYRSTDPVLAQIPVNARVIHVNPALGNDQTGQGLDTSPFRTISYALTQVTDNTVIQLAPGSYTADTGETFPLILPSGVILRGNESTQGQTVLVLGGGDFISPTFSRQSMTILATGNSQIRGITVTNPRTRGTGVWVEEGTPTIRDSTFTNSLRDGVFISGTGNPTIEDNVFANNDGNGISVARRAQGTIRDNDFQSTGFGIAVGDSATPLIVDNRILNNVDGVVVSNEARPVLRRNAIQNNQRDGVVAIANALPDLGMSEDDPGENVIRDNARYDIYNATRSNTLFAVGNDVNPSNISGSVEFVARAVDLGGGSRFFDVQGHWAQSYIEALASLDVIGGFPDGSYRPNDPVTRAQFAAIVNQAFSPSPKRSSRSFADVRSNFWAYDAIQTAYQGDFLSGYPGGIFRPQQAIPRVEVLVALASGLGLNAGQTAALGKYNDAARIPAWATGAIAAATEEEIVVNYPTVAQLNPTQNATRADVAAFVYQALVNAGQADPIESPYVVTYP
ncbi:MAG: DUF1565 domain-containing protein [Elainellaceae cyanobacterium]